MANRIYLTFIILFFVNEVTFCQSTKKLELKLEVSCFKDEIFVTDFGEIKPTLILGIRNVSIHPVKLKQELLFGQIGDTKNNDITFELKYIGFDGVDTIDKLKTISSGMPFRIIKPLKTVTLYANEAHLVNFTALNVFYIDKPGIYLIRFTLLKKYAPEYLINDISTEWVSFKVHLKQ
jgi:hypothetical protein